ncbi:MAG: hypothetical protein NTX98_03860, partial [Candidatus Doudnabacteria bacterium]|nr:hypothetical protein [Candidatus Doudnabacteria bacterium]
VQLPLDKGIGLEMKLPELTLGVSLETFGSRDTSRTAIRPYIAANDLLLNLRPAIGGTTGLASSSG